jgi:hypothetical protein
VGVKFGGQAVEVVDTGERRPIGDPDGNLFS